MSSPPSQQPSSGAPIENVHISGNAKLEEREAGPGSPADPADAPSTSCRTSPEGPQQKRARLLAPFRHPTAKTFSRQVHDLFLVLDLEATCTKRRDLFPIEIIELSALLLDSHSLTTLGEFQCYVRPTEHPRLDPFCVELTGIEQEQVDTAPLLADALPRLHQWLEGLGGLVAGRSLLPVTWTDWDLKVCLESECEWRKLPRPPYLRRWCNLKRLYTTRYRRTSNLQKCVEALGLRWQGRAHSGLDDSRNTAALVVKMIRDGCVLKVTDSFNDEAPPASGSEDPVAAATSESPRTAGSEAGTRAGGGGTALRQAVLTTLSGGPVAPAEAALYDSAGRWLGKCRCGVAAHFRTTKKPGANLGRQFYSCGRWTISDRSKQCSFFVWADQLQLAPGVVGAAAAVAVAAGSAATAAEGQRAGVKRRGGQ